MTMPNLIECDGCGEQIKSICAYQCVGCKKHFCEDCETPMPIVCLCPDCEKWAEGITADCEQRKQELIVAKIKAVMEILEQSTCGAVGKHGMDREELRHKFGVNLSYHAAQSAWLELNELLEAIA